MDIPEVPKLEIVDGADDEIISRVPRINPKEMLDLKQTRVYKVIAYNGKFTGTSKDDRPFIRYSWTLQDEFTKLELTNFDFFYKVEGKYKNKDLVGKQVRLTPFTDKKVALEILN